MDREYYRARAAEATRKARADLFNSHTYREIACCYERLAADSDQRNCYSASAARSARGQIATPIQEQVFDEETRGISNPWSRGERDGSS
jgi:hypothetical protein